MPKTRTGTTGAVAKRLGREWIGCEREGVYRQAALERIELALPLDESAPDPRANPVDDVMKNQFRTRLAELIAELREDERELLYLRYQADLNFREIAQIVRRSESAIKKQHLRLLARLQSQMELENEQP